jgi:hypothetical protein
MLYEQDDYEDALRIEVEYNEVCNTKEGKQLLRWLRRRRKAVEKFGRMFV